MTSSKRRNDVAVTSLGRYFDVKGPLGNFIILAVSVIVWYKVFVVYDSCH